MTETTKKEATPQAAMDFAKWTGNTLLGTVVVVGTFLFNAYDDFQTLLEDNNEALQEVVDTLDQMQQREEQIFEYWKNRTDSDPRYTR